MKLPRAIQWLLPVLAGLYLAALVLATDDPWQRFGLGVIALFSLPVLTALTVLPLCLTRGKSSADPVLAAFTRAVSLSFALLTLVLTAAALILAYVDLPAPYDNGTFGGILQIMLFAFGGLTVLPLLIGAPAQKLCRGKPRPAVRILSMVLICLCTAGILLIPYPAGSYNDGGSKIYQAVLYEAVIWHPAQTGREVLRVYFFPRNGISYEEKRSLAMKGVQ